MTEERKRFLMDRFSLPERPSYQQVFWAILDGIAQIMEVLNNLKGKNA